MFNVLKVKKARDSFVQIHPKIADFFAQQFANGEIEEGTVLELRVKKPNQNATTAKLTVSKKDIEIIEQLKG